MTTQTNAYQKPTAKEIWLQNAQILLWGILALLLVVLMTLELIPTLSAGLQVKEPITVTSSLLNVSQKGYLSVVSGSLYNPTDEKITVEGVTVVVGDGRQRHTVELKGFEVLPRTATELHTDWLGDTEYDRVLSIKVTVEGKEAEISNAVTEASFSVIAVFYLILLLPVALLLIRASKHRYYLYQESRMASEE